MTGDRTLVINTRGRLPLDSNRRKRTTGEAPAGAPGPLISDSPSPIIIPLSPA